MALQTDAIENRLEGLKQDEQRTMFDSKLRAFRMDSTPAAIPGAGTRAAKLARTPEPEYPVDRVVSLLEELSRRIDGLEKKDRALADEIRQRARKDQRRRAVVAGAGFAVAAFVGANWFMRWF